MRRLVVQRLFLFVALAGCGRLDFAESPPLPSALGTLRGPGGESGRDVTALPDGGFAVLGQFDKPVEFAGRSLVSAGDFDLFVMRLDAKGGVRWITPIGGPMLDNAGDITTDNSGNIYVAGTSTGPMDCGSGLLAPASVPSSGFICSFAPDGSLRWARGASGAVASNDGFTSSRVFDGVVYTMGTYTGTVDFGGGPTSEVGPISDATIVAYSAADGSFVSARRYSSDGLLQGRRLGFDRRGNLYATFTGTQVVDVGGGPIDTGPGAIVIASYDRALNWRWNTLLSGTSVIGNSALAVDDAGVYLIGTFSGDMKFGALTETPSGLANGYLAATSLEGAPRWVHAMTSTSGCTRLTKVSMDHRGRLLVAGVFQGMLPTGETTPRAAGVVAAYGTDGRLESLITQGDGNGDGATSAADSGRAVLAVGYRNSVEDVCMPMQDATTRDLAIDLISLP